MARCGCSSRTCNCLVQAGAGIDVRGSGTPDDPYIIVATTDVDISDAIRFVDTESVNFTVTGSGTATDPWTVTAVSSAELANLLDVACDSPTANDVLTFDGTAWVCAPISTEPGAINTADGVTGDGTVGNPISADTAADWTADLLPDIGTAGGQEQDDGMPVYTDSAGALRSPAGLYVAKDLSLLYPPESALWNDANVSVGSRTSPAQYGYQSARLVAEGGTEAAVARMHAGVDTGLPIWRMVSYQVPDGAAVEDPVPFASLAQRTDGQVLAYTGDAGGVTVRRPMAFAVAAGSVQLTNVTNGNPKTTTVSFPTRRFTTDPFVVTGTYTSVPGERFTSNINKSKTSVQIMAGYTGLSTSINVWVSWIAMQVDAPDPALQGAEGDGGAMEAFAAMSGGSTAGWLNDMPPTPPDDAQVTCPTEGCGNQGIPIPILAHWTDEEGNAHEVDQVQCGVCGSDITDTMEPL